MALETATRLTIISIIPGKSQVPAVIDQEPYIIFYCSAPRYLTVVNTGEIESY